MPNVMPPSIGMPASRYPMQRAITNIGRWKRTPAVTATQPRTKAQTAWRSDSVLPRISAEWRMRFSRPFGPYRSAGDRPSCEHAEGGDDQIADCRDRERELQAMAHIGDLARQRRDDRPTDDRGRDDTRTFRSACPETLAGQAEDRREHDR